MVTPSRSFQSLSRSLPTQDTIAGSPTHNKSLRSPPTNRLVFSSPDSSHSPANSSQSSSPNTSTPNSPAGAPATTVHYQRPSTLHGLKHKLHSAAKSIHSPSRRKSVGHIPLSPLARTPSPSPLPSSPTRSPSPLAFPAGHQPGSSNTTQSYSPGSSLTTPGSSGKKGFSRPKSAEPGSPLLRRALSPDRLHPRSAESKSKPTPTSISPLCNPALKVTVSSAPRVTITSQSSPVSSRTTIDYTSSDSILTAKPPEHPLLLRNGRGEFSVDKLLPFLEQQRSERRDRKSNLESQIPIQDHSASSIADFNKLDHRSPLAIGGVGVNAIVPGDRSSQHLPRIAEEKDSPTSSKEEVAAIMKSPFKISDDPFDLTEKAQKSNTQEFQSKVDSKFELPKPVDGKEEACGCKTNSEETLKTFKLEKSRKKEPNDLLSTVKGTKQSSFDKDALTRAADNDNCTKESRTRTDSAKWSAQEKRELFRGASSKDQ